MLATSMSKGIQSGEGIRICPFDVRDVGLGLTGFELSACVGVCRVRTSKKKKERKQRKERKERKERTERRKEKLGHLAEMWLFVAKYRSHFALTL